MTKVKGCQLSYIGLWPSEKAGAVGYELHSPGYVTDGQADRADEKTLREFEAELVEMLEQVRELLKDA